ncbi:MAG TPA: AvaI/BsoBI family type II restriction endonuclease [Ktedonobacteraceae bacterium]|nr:AvaI/BsoBI family type II restriction endonuclease [Ktedonobacteraceae bacterium]
MSLPPHILTANDLVTSQTAILRGYSLLSIIKQSMSSDARSEENRLRQDLTRAGNPQHVNINNTLDDLLTASGMSNKQITWFRLNAPAKMRLIAQKYVDLIANKYASSSNPLEWIDEICEEYLLTKGGSIVGSTNNKIGAKARKKFTRAILQALKKQKTIYSKVVNDKNADIVNEIHTQKRVILFDRKPKFLNNNIDIIIVDSTGPGFLRDNPLARYQDILACGELKGGIDPPGSDEHWKTANTALQRIHDEYNRKKCTVPALFFVGASIVPSVADKIINKLITGEWQYAANLTNHLQRTDIVDWLVAL